MWPSRQHPPLTPAPRALQTVWCCFPLISLASMTRLISYASEELMWTLADFLGKVMFSSSLLYSNLLTIEERRRIAMRVIEETNRQGAPSGQQPACACIATCTRQQKYVLMRLLDVVLGWWGKRIIKGSRLIAQVGSNLHAL